MEDDRKDTIAMFKDRYINNGMLDWLKDKKKAGIVRNQVSHSFIDVKVFDPYALRIDEGKVRFVQIELNYLDWKHAHEINEFNVNADYLYNELAKRGIPAVIMEPLLGGRLTNVPNKLVAELKERDPEHFCRFIRLFDMLPHVPMC